MHRWCQIIPAAAAVDKYHHLHHHGHPFHSLPRSTFLFTPPRSARPLIYYTDMSQNTQSAKTHTTLLSHLMYITLLHTTQHISTHSPAQPSTQCTHYILTLGSTGGVRRWALFKKLSFSCCLAWSA